MNDLEKLAQIVRAHRSIYDIHAHTTVCTCGHEYGRMNDTRRANHIAQAIINAGWTPPTQESHACERDGMGICKHCGNGINVRHIINGTEPPCPGKPNN